jgi:hypothetical protein
MAAPATAAVAAAAAEPMTLTILFSNKQRWWHRFWTELKSVESVYPGLNPLRFEFEGDSDPPQPALSSDGGTAGVVTVAAAAAAAFEGRYQRFEDYLLTTRDGVQVAIAHSRAAAQYAKAVQVELAGLDSEVSVGLVGPGGKAPAECRRPLILVVCVDDNFARDPALLAQFKAHVEQRRPVIPLILPGCDIPLLLQSSVSLQDLGVRCVVILCFRLGLCMGGAGGWVGGRGSSVLGPWGFEAVFFNVKWKLFKLFYKLRYSCCDRYVVRSFDRWWPDKMQEMENFALFVGGCNRLDFL